MKQPDRFREAGLIFLPCIALQGIYNDPAGHATLLYGATCAVIFISCIFGWWVFYLPFIATTAVVVTFLVMSRKFLLRDQKPESLKVITITAIVSLVASVALFIILCFCEVFTPSQSRQPFRSQAGASPMTRIMRRNEDPTGAFVTAGPGGDDCGHGLQDCRIQGGHTNFARRHKIVGSWGMPAWMLPPIMVVNHRSSGLFSPSVPSEDPLPA
ncbi:unnamed protein product [Notodromas monacha]|uniref:Uncharacterized protein n=1 Tax=Notodromas monacha TaxID=399045 RepID=A0A7R9BV69_9CRUS|nr:unnamed protein product [Notodromas monacha]CAD7283495.1 unnamed protein product [Notodromas monacha]CAG0920998.1 unnamed protein product [Notodromas monacha]CAG0923647.1 unnamed protein product [Notodromas monacha]